MPRYIKQPNKYSCGPVALMNAFKWGGFKFSYAEQRELFYDLCHCDPDGSSPHFVDQGFRIINETWGSPLKILRRRHVTKKELDSRLNGGESVVLLTGRTPSLYNVSATAQGRDENYFWGHYIFIPRRAGSSYVVINDARSSDWGHVTTYRAPNNRMRRMLQRYGATGREAYPTAWFLTAQQEKKNEEVPSRPKKHLVYPGVLESS